MTILEIRNLLDSALGDTVDRFNIKQAEKFLNEKMSEDDDNPNFAFTISEPTNDQKWAAIAVPRFGKDSRGNIIVRQANVDLNLSMYKLGLFSDNPGLVCSVMAAIIYKCIFDLSPLREIREFAFEAPDMLKFCHVHPSGDEYPFNENNVLERLLKYFPSFAVTLFAYPEIWEVPNSEIKDDLEEFKRRSITMDLYDYRFEEVPHRCFVEYILTKSLTATRYTYKVDTYLNRSGLKKDDDSFTIEYESMGSSIASKIMTFVSDNFRLYIGCENLKDESELEYLDVLLEGAMLPFIGRKLDYMEMERQIDLLSSEIDNIRSLSDKQALIDICWDKINKVNKFIDSHPDDKRAQDLLSTLMNLRSVIRESKIQKKRGIINITGLPEGFEG